MFHRFQVTETLHKLASLRYHDASPSSPPSAPLLLSSARHFLNFTRAAQRDFEHEASTVLLLFSLTK